MDVRKFAVLLVSLILIGATASAYIIGGDSSGEIGVPPDGDSACTDDNDNDDDGEIDEDDPGCTYPYNKDDSESAVYDLDASWVFSDQSAPDQFGPSAFYGATVVDRNDEDTDDVETVSAAIDEAYVANSVENWGGGQVRQTEIGSQDTTDTITGFMELIDYPMDGQCGDTQDDGESTTGCPEDVGLPDDPSPNAQNGESSETISQSLDSTVGSWNVNSLSGDGVEVDSVAVGDNYNSPNHGSYFNGKTYDDDTTDTVFYQMDLSAPERSGSYTEDISGVEDNINGQLTFEDEGWNNAPDFFRRNEDEIWVVYPAKSGEEVLTANDGSTSVTDKDLTASSYTNFQPSGDTIKNDCEANNVNSSCETTGSKKCVDTTDNDVYDQELDKDNTKTFSAETTEYGTQKDGGHEWTSDNNPGRNLEVTVTYDQEGTQESVTADNCQTWEKAQKCEEDCIYGGSCSTDCTLDDTHTVYTDQSTDHDATANHDGYYNDGYSEDTRSYYYETLELRESKAFDINPAENPSGGPGNSKDALFYGDSFHGQSYTSSIVHNSYAGDAYWSYQKTMDDILFGNDDAVSSSSFRVRIDGDEFVSVRNYFRTWDADGSKGQGDGFVSIIDPDGWVSGSKRITGWSNEFLQRESTGSNNENDASASFVTNPVEDGTNSDYQFTIPDCPSPFTHCVSAVDVAMKNLNHWNNPTSPDASSVQWEFKTKSTNKSLGVCEMAKRFDSDSQLQSNYDSQSGATTQEDQRCIGDRGDGEELWAYMEGPEVDEEAVSDQSGHYEINIDDPSDCVLRGKEVSEGHVADVANETYPEYEEGGHSPDWEVCLNIDQEIPGGPGDDVNVPAADLDEENEDEDDNYDYNKDGSSEEVGGEWWDMDNDRVNEYLRGDGSHLVSTGSNVDSNNDGTYNEHDVDYYWQQNQNPYHPEYNPSGESKGLPLEDDCHEMLVGCSDEDDVTGGSESREKFVYTFFTRAIP